MGSKSPDREYEAHNGHASKTDVSNRAGGLSPKSRHSQDGDGCLGGCGTGDGEDEGDGDQVKSALDAGPPFSSTDGNRLSEKSKKPKKKKKSKKRGLGLALAQSSPPRVPLDDIFLSGSYPTGELQSYVDLSGTIARATAAERRAAERRYWEDEGFLQDYRKAAEVHRQTRKWVRDFAQPGRSLIEIANGIEDSVRALLSNQGLEPGAGLKSGMGFPTGLCLNHQVAHYTPNPGRQDVFLKQKDVLTVDFGVHINGWIVDSAFTTSFNHTYDNLLEAVQAATNIGIKTAGVDVRISDVSAAIQETMESYEVEVEGKTLPVKPVRNLSGHNIVQNRIHGGKSIPFVRNTDQTKMEEGEVFAIETFGSTGRGVIEDDAGVYGYSLIDNAPLKVPLPLNSAERLHKTIRENFGTIPFCRRYMERLGLEKYLAGMNCLVSHGIVEEYYPLADIKGSHSAQFEHTFLLRETCKEVFSRGDDY